MSLVTAVVEVSDASPPLTVKPQLAELAAAGVPLVIAIGGPVRAAKPAVARALQGAPVVTGKTAAQARQAAMARVATPYVAFLPAGWEIDPGRLGAMARLLLDRDAAAVVPVALDAGGSVLGAGLLWADDKSLPQRLLAGHPAADVAGRVFEVPSAHPEGLTIRTADVAAAQAPAPWWPVQVLAGRGPVIVDGHTTIAIPRFAPPAARGRKKIAPQQADAVIAAAPPDAVARSRAALAAVDWRAVGVEPTGENRWRALVSRPVATQPVATRRWALKIGAPAGRRGDPWGDVFFADDLAAALRGLGNDVVIDRDGSAGRAGAYLDRVVLNVRGYQVLDRQPGAVNLLWIISHPDDVPAEEMRRYDRVYAASASWPAPGQLGVAVTPLLQATNPARFNPDAAQPDTGPDLLFVGNSRHQFRPIVADCRAAGLRPTVIGRDWEKFLPADEIAALSVSNADLPAAYRSAGIVLNDHWGDMASHGFLNNRLFDAVACGARVVSDPVPGLVDIFGDAVAVYETPDDLARLCRAENRATFGTDEQRREHAARLAQEHSFLARARALMADAARVEILPES